VDNSNNHYLLETDIPLTSTNPIIKVSKVVAAQTHALCG